MSAGKLRDLIRAIRSCKTAAEEREVVQREKANIRNSFTQNKEVNQARNLAKLLFINMMGYDTDFGQMECLKLITSNSYSQKRIGYLGLTQLFNEKSEVLMLATNRMRMDLSSQSNYILATALTALSEICTADMCRELAADVARLMIQGGNTYIKKKAILAATRIIRKVPETLDDFLDKIDQLMEETSNNSILVTTIALIKVVMQVSPDKKEKYKKYVPDLIRVLKNLLTNYSSEYDVSGVSDPFLQVEIINFLQIIAEGDNKISEEISEILAQVVTNTTSNKNAGNAVLYENVRAIMAINSASSLKTLGINILGRFLGSKDANSKYVSLVSLKKVLKYDISAVEKHKQMIVNCLKENEDNYIKKLALDLVYLIINKKNIKSVVKELLNILIVSDQGIMQELTLKICTSVEKYAPSRRWYVDTIIKVLTLAGNYVEQSSISQIIHVIQNTPELQRYSITKIYFSLKENTKLSGLCLCGLWCIGEYGQMLIDGKAVGPDSNPIIVKDEEVVDLIEEIMLNLETQDIVKEVGLTCLMKLYTKFISQQQKITSLIDLETQSCNIEIQQRACEYMKIIECNDWGSDRYALFELVPIMKEFNSEVLKQSVGDNEIDEVLPLQTTITTQQESQDPVRIQRQQPSNAAQQQQAVVKNETKVHDLMDDLFELTDTPAQNQKPAQNQQTTSSQAKGSDFNLLVDVFDTVPQNTSQPQQQQQQQQDTSNLFNLFDAVTQPQQKQQQQQQQSIPLTNLYQQQQPQQQLPFMMNQQLQQPQQQLGMMIGGGQMQQKQTATFTAFEDNNLQIVFNCEKTDAESIQIKSSFNNKNQNQLTDLVFQVAVLKHLKLVMNPINSNTIPANSYGQINQSMTIQNSLVGKKGVVMKVKISYKLLNQEFTQQVTVQNFPDWA